MRVFFAIMFDRQEQMARMLPVDVTQTLPVVLSPEDVSRLVGNAGNLKHQTFLSVHILRCIRANTYSFGLLV